MMDIEKLKYIYNSFVETFIEDQYGWLSIGLKEHTIALDFGTQAGDSAFYLLYNSNNKISKIYAYEIDKSFYDLLIKNLKYDNEHKIIPLNKPAEFDNEIMKNPNIIIKCDIESAEHNLFKENSNLSNVYKIQLEYHKGVQNLENILKNKGFNVKAEPPRVFIEGLGDIGWIYAWR